MPIKSRCCNPFCCFSACAQTAPSESGPGASHDVADVSGVPRCDKAPPSGSSNVDARLNVSGPPRCDDGSSSGSSNVPKTRSEEEDVDVNLNASRAPPCINEASTSGSSNVPNRSEEQDVDFNLNVSGDPRCINEAPSCSSSSGATKSRPDLISSIHKDIVEVEDVNLDDLMNHISELLKLREEGKKQQASNIRKFPWPNVPGLQKLKEIVSFGTDLQKLQNMLSAALTFGSELKNIIHGPVTAVLKDIGKVSVASAGLLVVAYTLETIDDAFTNNKKCWHLIKEMSHVASIVKRLKERPQGMPQFVMEEATSLLVEGAIMCCNQIGGSAWKKLFLSSKIKGDLSDITQKLNAMYLQINIEIGFRLLSAVEREGRSPLSKGYPTHAVGINEPVKEVLRLLEIESDKKVATVILQGLGGMGKTTLAEAVFSEVGGCKYSKVGLFKDINSTPDIIELQKLILKDLVEPGETIPEIRIPDDGRRELQRVLANVDAFIYIDNVLEASALRMLLPDDITEAKKVRLLLTARDDGVKNSCPGTKPKIYKMKGIEDEEAIFILKRKIMEGIDDSQFNNIIEACGGIPLLLTVAASVIGGDDKKQQEAYSRLMREKHTWIGDEFKEMRRVFAFAYDSLPPERKDPFLDICAYFNGWKWDIVQDIVGEDALRMFESRSLVTKATNGDASVHDVILPLAHQKSVEESNGKEVRLRFTSARELEKFLEEEDTEGIKGISLARDYGAALHICASRLDSMHNSLRILHLESPTKVEGNCNKIFKELIYLKANIIQLPFYVSQLKQLRYLSYEFPEMPSILQLLNFDGRWQSRAFQVLSTDFIQLQNLRVLIFNNFTKLKELPKKLGKLVRVLELIGCESIRTLPEGLDQLENLKELVLRRCRSITELCNDFSSLSLQILDVSECDRLEQFPGNGSCPSTDISVQEVSISENNKENMKNGVLSELDRLLTNGRGEAIHLSDLLPNTSALLIFELDNPHKGRFLWPLIEETVDDGMKIKIIYIGPHFDQLPTKVRDTIFVVHTSLNCLIDICRNMALTAEGDVKGGNYVQMDAKMVGDGNNDNYAACFCWRFLTASEMEEFVVCNSGRYLRLKQLQAETDGESSNIEMLRELFAPDGDETTPVFQKNESSQKDPTDNSERKTTCGVDKLKGKTILVEMWPSNSWTCEINHPFWEEMYFMEKEKVDLEIISIPIVHPEKCDVIDVYKQFSRQVPWLVLQNSWTVITRAVKFFFEKHCGWEEPHECEKWYPTINWIIDPNGRISVYRPYIFLKEEWEQPKNMSTLEFLFNYSESVSAQVQKLMLPGKLICLYRKGDYDRAIDSMWNALEQQQRDRIHIIHLGRRIRMASFQFTENIKKDYYYPFKNTAEIEGMSSLNLSQSEIVRFSLRLCHLEEEINRMEDSELKFLLNSFQPLHSFQKRRNMLGSIAFMDGSGKVVAALGGKNLDSVFGYRKDRTQCFIKSIMNDIEGGGKEMHDEDPGVFDSLIQNLQTTAAAALEQQNVDAYFESLREYISERWEVEFYQAFRFNKEGKKRSLPSVTWPTSRGFCRLKNFLSEGISDDWFKDIISRHPEEEDQQAIVIHGLLKDIEEAQWAVAGLLAVGDVLERFQTISADGEYLSILWQMSRMAQYIKQFDQKPGLWRGVKRVATAIIVGYSYHCCSQIHRSRFALFSGSWNCTEGRIMKICDIMAKAITEGPSNESGPLLEEMYDCFPFFNFGFFLESGVEGGPSCEGESDEAGSTVTTGEEE